MVVTSARDDLNKPAGKLKKISPAHGLQCNYLSLKLIFYASTLYPAWCVSTTQ